MLSGWKRREPVNSVSNLTRDLITVERERDAALAVIAEVREALAPGRPIYDSLGAARAALEKVSD